MNLYLISQTANNDYDTYSDAVVCCETEEIARNMDPSNGEQMTESDWAKRFGTWCYSVDQVSVVFLGVAHTDVKRGIVCSSFHAG